MYEIGVLFYENPFRLQGITQMGTIFYLCTPYRRKCTWNKDLSLEHELQLSHQNNTQLLENEDR